jgi:hypothetical protein
VVYEKNEYEKSQNYPFKGIVRKNLKRVKRGIKLYVYDMALFKESVSERRKFMRKAGFVSVSNG